MATRTPNPPPVHYVGTLSLQKDKINRFNRPGASTRAKSRLTEQANKPLPCRVRQFREAAKLSLLDMALHVHLTRDGLNAIECGGNATLREALEIARFFRKNLSDLWPTDFKDY